MSMDGKSYLWTQIPLYQKGLEEYCGRCWTLVDVGMVARDGIEPPTPAFSGPRSTTELSGLGEPKGAASAYVVSESAASGGGPGQVSNCAQATRVSIAIASLRANFPPANPRRSRWQRGRPVVHWTLTPISCGACGVGEPHAAFLNESRTRSHGWSRVQEIRVAVHNPNTPVAFALYVPTPCSNLPGPPCRRLHAAALPGAVRHRAIASRSAEWR